MSKILETVNQSLREKCMLLKEGKILDATIINPQVRQSTAKERGILKWTKLSRAFSVSLGCAVSGLCPSSVSASTDVHDLNTATECVLGQQRMIYGDSGNIGIEKREAFMYWGAEIRVEIKTGLNHSEVGTRRRANACLIAHR